MIVGIADTHTVLWHLSSDSRLSATARAFIENAAQNGDPIGVSAITLVETVYLVEKGRISASRFTELSRVLEQFEQVFREIPVNLGIVRALSRVDAVKVPDMPDRIIAATAVYFRVPIISKDSKIQLSGLKTIW